MKIVLLILLLIPLGIDATTYPKLSLEKFNNISDVNVIVKITSKEVSKNSENEYCDRIGRGQVIELFKGPKNVEVISFNIYKGMEVGEYYHLMLKDTSSKKSYKTTTNSEMMEDERREQERCLSAKKPDYTILMEGIGSTKVDLDVKGTLENAMISYSNNWVVPPESITVKVISEGWDGRAEVRYTDLVEYLESQNTK
ncbi:MAG: hypothetical protein OQJ95_11540 [Kangiella sp.]|nr:hypothetical protein [Kangiella sp.]